MHNKQHIFLTGFMGSGKSTLGKKLAALLQLNFVDLDKVIEEKESSSIAHIFETQGEAYFRRLESACLAEVILANSQSVISLGGGTVCFHDNLTVIKPNGLLIYIQLPIATLSQRIAQSGNKRPLLKELSGAALLQYIEETLKQREKYYSQAHISVNGLNLSAQQLQQSIFEYSKKNNN